MSSVHAPRITAFLRKYFSREPSRRVLNLASMGGLWGARLELKRIMSEMLPTPWDFIRAETARRVRHAA